MSAPTKLSKPCKRTDKARADADNGNIEAKRKIAAAPSESSRERTEGIARAKTPRRRGRVGSSAHASSCIIHEPRFHPGRSAWLRM